jgi:hypothetical protein
VREAEGTTARRWKLPAEAPVLVLYAAWSLLPAAILFIQVKGGLAIGSRGRMFTGADLFDVPDQLQYLAWIRDAGSHVLFANRFNIAPDPHLFLHPLFGLSALVWKLGASLQLSYLLWRPVAVAVVFVGFAAYVRRLLPAGGWPRPAALTLALFLFTPATAVAELADVGDAHLRFGLRVVGLELFPGGYTAIGIVVGLMPLYLLAIERLVAGGRARARTMAGAAAAGLLVMWIHPWQGLILLALSVVAAAGGPELGRRARALAIPVVATALPLAYYVALSHTDSAWATVSTPNHFEHVGWWFVLGIVPPLALAAPGVRLRGLDLQERMLLAWPVAALGLYFALNRSWFYHAFDGMSLPLAILAVRGLRRVRAPAPVAALAVLAFTVPGLAAYVKMLRREAADHFVVAPEAAALSYLARMPAPGGVLAREPLGSAVPAFADRQTWVGHPTWTPGWTLRAPQADALFTGRLPPAQARDLVRRTGARFVLADCHARADLSRLLGAAVGAPRRFGCAAVYAVRR